MRARPPMALAALVAVTAFAGVVAGCGSDDRPSAAAAPATAGHAPPGHAPPGPAPPGHAPAGGAPARGTLRVTSNRRQRMEGFGTAVASDSVVDPWAQTGATNAPQARRVDALMLRSGIRLVRIFGPGQAPGPAGVRVWSAADGRLRLMRRLQRRGVRFVFTGQGAPPALVEGGGETGALLRGQEERYAAFLAACLEVAQRAGTPFEFAAIGNEVDNPGDPGVSLTAGQAATVTRALAGEITRRRLRVRLVLGDTLNWRSTLGYAEAQVRALAGRRPAFVASHGYGADEARPALARFAAARRLPLWMTEWVSACPRGDCPDDPTIGFALRWARQINDDLTSGSASAWFMFRGFADSTHGADGAIVVRERSAAGDRFTTTKRHPIVRQFALAAPPGSRRLETRGQLPGDVRALAFSGPRRRSVVLTNLTHSETRVRVLLGSRRGELRGWRTSAAESFRATMRRRVAGGGVNISLAPESVTTLVVRETR
jgi:O-glycosyl hydrolase